jgi:hypothetical protein
MSGILINNFELWLAQDDMPDRELCQPPINLFGRAGFVVLGLAKKARIGLLNLGDDSLQKLRNDSRLFIH